MVEVVEVVEVVAVLLIVNKQYFILRRMRPGGNKQRERGQNSGLLATPVLSPPALPSTARQDTSHGVFP